MARIGRIFVRGLLAALPIVITIYILWWAGAGAEALLGPFIARLLPGELYLPGMGLLFGVVLVLLLGLMLQVFVVRRVFIVVEGFFGRIPLVKTLYGSVRDMLGLFSEGGKERGLGQVVLVDLGLGEARVLGFVTRERVAEVESAVRSSRHQDESEGSGERSVRPGASLPGASGDPLVAVYVPMSYQLGGFTYLVPRSRTTPLDLSLEEALRFAITAGARSDKGEQTLVAGKLPAARA